MNTSDLFKVEKNRIFLNLMDNAPINRLSFRT
jgi:hypothetical protein